MYKCTACGFKEESPVPIYDEYDCSSYPACKKCGGGIMNKSAECFCCGDDLFEGERIYKIGTDYFCKNCVKEIIA